MTSLDDLRSAVAADDGSLPERWNAEDVPGTTLVGTLLRYELIVTKLGEATIAVVEDADDSTVWGVMLGRTVLKKRFDTLEPKPGDSIGLKYVGWVEPRNKNDNGYHNYVLRVIRNAATNGTAASTAAREAAEGGENEDELPF